ncbi:MAG: hypothetical protein H7263_12380 [Candidatus Sericytochromatia bacterium]|nr:hypothetical protein [Candidatus Sericytochromatia bacterium]
MISYLFENRKINISQENIADLPFFESNKLDYLIENSILGQNADNISIDINLLEFFEDFLNISEQINTAYISDTVKDLESNIIFFIEETREKEKENYLSKIKRYLKGISRNIKKEIIALKRNTDLVYKTEQNFNIKKIKLEDYKQKRNDIIDLRISIGNILDSKRIILESIGDIELNSIILNVHKILEESFTYLIEIQQELIEYINKAQIYGEIFRKVQKLKYLKDHQEIKYKTNITKVIAIEHALILQPRRTFFYKISNAFLQSDEGFGVIKKLVKKNKQKNKVILPSKVIISDDYFDQLEELEEIIDLNAIKNAFYISGQDLFNFVMNFNLQKTFTFDERVTIFCKIISEYEDELIIKDDLGIHNKLNYALVYPG